MKPLLLLHGALGSADQLTFLAQALSGTHEVHMLNFSGHGGTPLPEQFSISQFAIDVLHYMTEHNLEQADIFGYSMGGYVALFMARHFPDKVGKIFTLATKFDWTEASAQKDVKMLDPEKIEAKVPAFANSLQERHAPQDWKKIMTETADMMLRMGAEPPLGVDDFAHIPHQVVLSIGDRDTMVSLEETIARYRMMPQSALLVLPQTPHPIEKADPERLVHELSSYFTSYVPLKH